MTYLKLFSFLLLLACVSVVLVSQSMADGLKYFSKSDPKIKELCKSVEDPSGYSKRVESGIVGQWIYIGYWKDVTNFIPSDSFHDVVWYSLNFKSDSLPNVVWHTLNFKKGGVIEYSYELRNKKKIVKRSGTYKFYHQGSPGKFPGRPPNVMVKDRNPLKAKNIIPFIYVMVGLDNRYPVSGGKVLKFKDIDGKEHIFVRQKK